MTEQENAIRKADAFTNAATRLIDDEQNHPEIEEHYPGFWADIQEHVIPLLEAEARKGSEELERLRQLRRQLR